MGGIPSSPRCKTCQAPFRGPFRPLFAALGKAPFAKNPNYCNQCYGWLTSRKGGAEVEISMLFADVRGSTPMAEQLGPARLAKVMDRFYGVGVDVLTRNDALIERFMGDQVVGYFIPGFVGVGHARRAIKAAVELLAATREAADGAAWVPVGVGVHTGVAYVGTVGSDVLELTALGESVNVAARLASVAEGGQVLVSEAAFLASGLPGDPERRDLTLKGVSTPVPVRVFASP